MIKLSILDTLFALVPLVIAAVVYIVFTRKTFEIAHASARMVIQLIAIGYFLTFLFGQSHQIIGYAFLTLMLLAASYISLRHVSKHRKQEFAAIVLALVFSVTSAMLWVAFFVLKLDPFYQPEFLIPISGMIMATGMNALSVCIERLQSEKNKIDAQLTQEQAKQCEKTAFNASLIPIVNSFFAVGLVSLPGMMTGQILSGVSPLIAVRYQIMVMSILFFSAVISVFFYLLFRKRIVGVLSL